MTITLFDLACRDDRRPSPFCWRTKYALAHKGLDIEAKGVGFTDIPALCGGGHKTVPIIEDGGTVICDSWAIAEYLDKTYPDRPALFSSPAEKALCRFVEAWAFSQFAGPVHPLYALDIHNHARPEDREYFRANRESRFGVSLEQAAAGREEKLPRIRTALDPLRFTLGQQSWLSGEAPGYADYIMVGMFLWIGSVGTTPLLTDEDPLIAWIDRVRDLHGGLGRSAPVYDLAA